MARSFLGRCFRLSCRICCFAVLVIVVFFALLFAYSYFFWVIPGQRAAAYEDYIKALIERRANSSDKNTAGLPKYVTHPLISNVTQLWSQTLLDQLNLEQDHIDEETVQVWGKYPAGEQTWIYIGGTNPGSLPWYTPWTPYTRYNASCMDDPDVCDSYNSAFNTLATELHQGELLPIEPSFKLAFADCDVSGGVCNSLALNPIMMSHLRIIEPCRLELGKSRMRFICSTRWTHIGLPLESVPFIRRIRIGDYVVPAFPSHYEQLRTLLVFDGIMDALKVDGSYLTREESLAEPSDRWEIPGEEYEKPRLGGKGSPAFEYLAGLGKRNAERYTSLREAVVE